MLEQVDIEERALPGGVTDSDDVRLAGSRDAIEQRRAQVWELYCRGMKVGVIATLMKVDRKTIYRDLKTLRERMATAVKEIDAAATVGEMVEHYEHIWRNAMMEYASAKTSAAKNAFLRTAMEAMNNKQKLMANTGLIPAVQNGGVNIQVNTQVNNIQKGAAEASMDELLARREELLRNIRERDESVIDADYTVAESGD